MSWIADLFVGLLEHGADVFSGLAERRSHADSPCSLRRRSRRFVYGYLLEVPPGIWKTAFNVLVPAT